ncbi:unnamed protein product [Closterium sp. Naga37s-1]|nr:unnamed protein product [Closterium sp. Naga37s-1]
MHGSAQPSPLPSDAFDPFSHILSSDLPRLFLLSPSLTHITASPLTLLALNEFIKEAVLAAVREELAAYKEEVNELRQREERNGSIAAVMEERERELAAMKQELAEHKQSTKLQFEEAEKRRVAEMREMRGQVEEREELVAVRREVAAVKEELGEHKNAERGR